MLYEVITDLGFGVGPRLNAAGRLEDMSLGVECLLTDDPSRAQHLAAELDRINRERRDLQASMVVITSYSIHYTKLYERPTEVSIGSKPRSPGVK